MEKTLQNGTDLKTVKVERDTWILELPPELCDAEGFAHGTQVSLTFKNGAIQGTYIRPSKDIDDFLDRVVADDAKYFEEIERIGD